jgi:hypothetical protein
MLPQLQKNGPIFFLLTCPITCRFQEINAVLGEQLSAEDEEAVMAEFENLEAQVWPTKHLEFLSVEKQPKIMPFLQTRLKILLCTRFTFHSWS